MHGHPVEFGIDGRQQAGELDFRRLPKLMKRSCAIFTAAPGEKSFNHFYLP
jgi:hypothetical protein